MVRYKKLIYKEPVIDEIQKQEEYLERSEDYDCAEAVMSAKRAVINAQEVEAIPVEWLRDWQDEVGTINEWWPIIQRIITVWQEEQEAKA